jgi:hypothetical protein
VGEAEGDIEARQRQALEHARDVLKFGRLGAQEFAPAGTLKNKSRTSTLVP